MVLLAEVRCYWFLFHFRVADVGSMAIHPFMEVLFCLPDILLLAPAAVNNVNDVGTLASCSHSDVMGDSCARACDGVGLQ